MQNKRIELRNELKNLMFERNALCGAGEDGVGRVQPLQQTIL